MNDSVPSSLVAPGRMDVVEQVLSSDPFFRTKLKESGRRSLTNRRGIAKRYSGLTVDLVTRLARARLDAVTMQRHEIVAEAFKFCNLEVETAA